MSNLIENIEPNSVKKLIIVLEEVDILIVKLHSNLCRLHGDIPTLIKNKQDWNKFLDKIDRNIYNNIILIMTTNKTLEFFNELDPSYLRDGRLDLSFTVEKI